MPLPEAPSREHPSSFVTDNLALTAFLSSIGHTPTLVDTGTSKVLFSFERTPELFLAVTDFRDGRARINPAAYDASRRTLRQQMDELRGGNQ